MGATIPLIDLIIYILCLLILKLLYLDLCNAPRRAH